MGMVRKVTQIGWDCHRKFSVVSMRDQDSRVMQRRRIEHRDRAALRRVLRSWPSGTPVVLEATFGWSWVADELEAAGLRPRLSNSGKVALWRKARGLAKSNRLDGDLLSALPSEKENWWEVWLPPREVREQRELLRYRMALVQAQTSFKNRVHAILHRHGVLHDFSDLFGRQGRRFLNLLVSSREDALVNRREDALGETGRTSLKAYLQLLDHVRLLIAQATRAFRAQVQRSPIARRLMTLPGVKWILGYTILAEIGRIERFRRSKNLASYSLLAPRADDTGDDDGSHPIGRHVGHVGRVTLKWAWIEAARSAVRKDARLRAIFQTRTANGTKDRSQGYVAVARHLCVCAYALWKSGADYSATPPPRPGSKPRGRLARTQEKPHCPRTHKKPQSPRTHKKPQSSRPGTGQPVVAMVPVAEVTRQQA